MNSIELRLLGPLVVRRADGSIVRASEWKTTKTLDLLRLLALDAGGGVLDRKLLDPRGDVQALDHHPKDRVRGVRVEVVPGVGKLEPACRRIEHGRHIR